MKTFSFDNEARLNLIKDAQKAINKACFVPSKEAKSEALKAVKMLATFVEGLETEKPKPKPKASQQPKVETQDVQSLIAEATAKAVAEALAKLGVAQPKAQPKEQPKEQPKVVAKTKSKTSKTKKAVRRTAKVDSNTRLEAQAQRASRGMASTYLPKEEAQDKSKDKSRNKQMALPFEHQEGRCPIEEARHAAFLAMQEALLDGAPMDTDGYMDEYSF